MLLESPRVFGWFTRALGGPACMRGLIARLPPGTGAVLDLGCGLGNALAALPATVTYVGVDRSARYIRAARDHWGSRGRFLCADVTSLPTETIPPAAFDAVLAIALLHHVDDAGIAAVCALVRHAIRPGGVVLTIDPAPETGSRIARAIIARDRGACQRTADHYRALLAPLGPVEAEIRTDLLRIPYAHLIQRVTVR